MVSPEHECRQARKVSAEHAALMVNTDIDNRRMKVMGALQYRVTVMDDRNEGILFTACCPGLPNLRELVEALFGA